jgi:plasmid stabilization system protein ParE
MPRYRVTFTDKAKDQLRAAMVWWRKHRPEAPDLLKSEMRDAVGLLRETPEIAPANQGPQGTPINRWPLHGSRRMVFFLLDREARLVTIVAVWGAVRGKGPPLR